MAAAPLPAPVEVDPEMWETIVLNLLSNAYKYTFAGGVEVSVSAEDGPEGAPEAVVRVRDTGTGVPEGEVPRLFERFHRVAGARGRTLEGTGIGLALSRELVEMHGGTIAATSVHEGAGLGASGTTFTVRLPFGTAPMPDAPVPTAPSAPARRNRRGGLVEEAGRWGVTEAPLSSEGAPDAEGAARDRRPRVLVADDNADMRAYLRRLLGDLYQVETAANGQDALAAAQSARPDLVLTDVMMPGLGGFGLLRAFRADALLQDVPVVILSARAGPEARVEGLEAGADDYLVKPFTAAELRARVASTLHTSRFRRDLARQERVARVAAESAAARTERLQAITAALSNAHTPEEVGSVVIREGAPALGAFSGSLGLLLPGGTHLRFVDTSGFPSEVADVFRTVAMDAALPGPHAVRTGETLWMEDPDALASAFADLSGLVAQSGARAGIALPLRTDGDVFGVLLFSFRAPEAFTAERRAFAETLARLAAQALDRARLYDAEREGRRRFQLLADAVPQLVWELDASGEAVFISQRFFAYTGLRPPSTRAARAAVIHPDDRRQAEALMGASLEARLDFEIEVRLRRHDGAYRSHLQRGVYAAEVQRWYLTATDIEDLKAAAGTLRESEARARLALDIAALGTWSWDLTTGLGTLDARSGEILGLLPEDFTPGVAFDVAAAQAALILPEDLPGTLHAMQAGVKRGDPFPLHYRVRHPDGRVRHVVSSVRVVQVEHGQPVRLLGTNRDVTDERDRETRTVQLQALTAALAAATTVARAADLLLTKGRTMLNARAGALGLVDAEARVLDIVGLAGHPPDVTERLRQLPLDQPSPATEAVRTGEPQWARTRAENAARFPETAAIQAQAGTDATMALPLRAGGEVIGALAFGFDGPQLFSNEEKALALALADVGGQAFEQIRLRAAIEAERQRPHAPAA